ncbi:S-phase kinase-associated protein 1-like [Cotesia glomerata]|uniref:S-phase kinase-associated protein 1-like n=1 Tax=Cotesia glomerata TaxID=32391 RepID=UPI001D00FC11|nr:S-phase kinase-associated protein 1-like [Cotesia glomerata]
MSTTIKLLSSDKEVFEVDTKVAKMSATIKTMLEDLGLDEGDDEMVPLPSIEGPILKKIVEWAEHHKSDPPAPEDDDNKEKRSDDIPEWDVDFLKVDQQTLFAIIRAANFLDIKGLMDVTCKTVANMIKGKTPEEIRKTFNITPMVPTADDDAAKKEAEWSEEKDEEIEKKKEKEKEKEADQVDGN